MRYIILIFSVFLIFLSLKSFGSSWVRETDWGKDKDYQAFTKKGLCTQGDKYVCHDAAACAKEECDITSVEVDDYEKPTYEAAKKVVSCDGETDCKKIMTAEYCKSLGLEYAVYASKDWDEVYCTRQTGYAKKMVRKPIQNLSKKQARDSAKADKAQKKADRKALMEQCKQLDDNATLEQLRPCLVGLIKK